TLFSEPDKAFDRFLVIGDCLFVLFIDVETGREHPPCFSHEMVISRSRCQFKSLPCQRNAACGPVVTRLARRGGRSSAGAANLLPDAVKCLLQILFRNHFSQAISSAFPNIAPGSVRYSLRAFPSLQQFANSAVHLCRNKANRS